MNPDLMRKIDRGAGIPLCFLLSLMNSLGRIFRRPVSSGPPRRIMFIELAESGALVAAYPAIYRTKQSFPEAELFFLTFPRGAEILSLMGAVNPENIITIRPDNFRTFLLDAVRVILRLRREGIDTIVNLETFTRFSTSLAFLTGAGRRVGFHRFHGEGGYTGNLVTHRVVYNPHCHAARTFLSLVEAVSETPGPEPLPRADLSQAGLDLPRTGANAQAREAVLKLLSDHSHLDEKHRPVLLNPNASDLIPARRWPDQYWLALAQGLLEDPDILLVFTGSPEERPKTELLAQTLNSDRVLNLAGKTTIPQLIELYHLSHLLVTNDSGPAHFASLTDIPILVFYGPETPAIYGPLGSNVNVMYLNLACSPCVSPYNQKRTPCRDNRCLKGITPEAALDRARQILDNHKDHVG